MQGERWFYKLEPDREQKYWASHMGSEDGSDGGVEFGIER